VSLGGLNDKWVYLITAVSAVITEWLQDMGLELKPSKTKVSHT